MRALISTPCATKNNITGTEEVETSQVLNDILSNLTGTAGRLRVGHPLSIDEILRRGDTPWVPSTRDSESPRPRLALVGSWFPPQRRPAVPMASASESFRTWDVSTSFAVKLCFRQHGLSRP
jgi:hypothetical protein